MDDMVDALSDVLTAESVHHLVLGNPQRAGISVDLVGRGAVHPAESEVVRTPRLGTAVTQRERRSLRSRYAVSLEARRT